MKNKNSGINCLVTGGTAGIGTETVKGLALKGYFVNFTARNLQAGELLAKKLSEDTGNNNIKAWQLDLSSQQSIRQFLDKFKQENNKLDVLINNAGTWESVRSLTVDGIETTFAVNHLGPFLLTIELLPLLRIPELARIINVASALYTNGQINFNDLELKQGFTGIKAYCNSKLANVLFTRKLSRLLSGSGITVNCLHPGVVSTSLVRNSNGLIKMLIGMFAISPAKGAETSLYLASEPGLDDITGKYFVKKKEKELKGIAMDYDTAEKLWQASLAYVKASELKIV